MPLPPALPGASCPSVVGDSDRQENIRNLKKGFSDLYACAVSCKYFQNPQEAAQRDQEAGAADEAGSRCLFNCSSCCQVFGTISPSFFSYWHGHLFHFSAEASRSPPLSSSPFFFFFPESKQAVFLSKTANKPSSLDVLLFFASKQHTDYRKWN